MKKLLFVFSLVVSIFCGCLSVQAQNKLTPAQLKEVVTVMKTQLPMQVEEGITWTDVKLESPNTLNFEIKLNANMSEIMREGLKNMTDAEVCEAMGSEYKEVMTKMGCPGKLTLIFSNGTKKVYKL